jgi:uncharacterized membrane protein
MDLDKATGRVLRYGVYVSIIVMLLGLVVSSFDVSVGSVILNIGVSILVLTPFFSILASSMALFLEKDFRWLRVSLTVLIITIIGILVAFFT